MSVPYSAKEIFGSICSILYRRRLIDKAYREIQQTQRSTVYPHLPIFEANRDDSDDDVDDTDDLNEPALNGADSLVSFKRNVPVFFI